MQNLLTEAPVDRAREFREFVSEHVETNADAWDRAQAIPDAIVARLAKSGYLGSTIPTTYDGQGWSTDTFGLLNEAFGKGSSALTDLLTVQAMVSMTLLKWGTEVQKRQWLPPLARGEIIGAYALTEPSGGSDLHSIRAELKPEIGTENWRLNGAKTWISFGQRADLFLVFGVLNQKSIACLVPRGAPGMRVKPIEGMIGFRAAGLAQIEFENVPVTPAQIVGRPGVALSHLAPVGLFYGRVSTACSALGLLRGCLEASAAHAARRKIGTGRAGDLGMIRSMLARMGTDWEASRLVCQEACRAADEHLPGAFVQAVLAKYFTSKAAVRAASDAVQIHGALGCQEGNAVSRYYRDAKLMEIIEGTSQIHEEILGRHFLDHAPKTTCPGPIHSLDN